MIDRLLLVDTVSVVRKIQTTDGTITYLEILNNCVENSGFLDYVKNNSDVKFYIKLMGWIKGW